MMDENVMVNENVGAGKEAIKATKVQYIENLKHDPELAARRLQLSNKVEVTHIVRCKGLMGRSPKSAAGRIVGYVVKNIGDTNLPIKTTLYSGEGPGNYTGTPTEVMLEPGKSIRLSKPSMAINFTAAEYGGLLANGRVNADIEKESIEDILNSTTFSFKKEANISITSPEITEFADKKVGDGYELKKEYIEVFGYLANTVAVNKAKETVSDKEAQAFYIYTKAKEAGLIPADM